MKQHCILTLILLFMLTLMSGCASGNLSANVDLSIDIYGLSRKEFFQFTESPSLSFLQEYGGVAHYSQGGTYINANDICVSITDDFIRFAGNSSNVETYLSQEGYAVTVRSCAVIDAPFIPMIVWVHTDQGIFYITVTLSKTELAYTLYTEAEFCDKVQGEPTTLLVEGALVAPSCPPIMYHNYADIPLLSVLRALGAEVDDPVEGIVGIGFRDEEYRLDLTEPSLYRLPQTENLLISAGGACVIYQKEGELMLDSDTLSNVLNRMRYPVSIRCNKTGIELYAR